MSKNMKNADTKYFDDISEQLTSINMKIKLVQ